MSARYVMAIDQGTTSSRAILFDRAGRLASVAQYEHRPHFPNPGWVEHDAAEIWRNVGRAMSRALAAVSASATDVAAIGITNQRETVVIWDRETGVPVRPAITWQDTRTEALVDELRGRPGAAQVAERSGLPL